MKHFNEGLWVDFVRGTASKDVQQEMQTHLNTGCVACQSVVDWMQRVEGVAAADRKQEIPREWIARARAIFRQPGTKNAWIDDLVAIMGELIFATRFEVEGAGIRSFSTAAGGGRMMFRAGDYQIHVNVAGPTAGEPGEIVGQISNDADPPGSQEGMVVQATANGRMLSETTANRFGEFVMEYPFLEQATLRLASRERALLIEVPLYQERNSAAEGE